MKYKFIIITLLFSLNLFSAESEKLFKKSLKKWNRSNIKEYCIKVEFSALSPIAGIWELDVNDGKIVQCSFNGEPAENCQKTAEMFTMENLYKTAGESHGSGGNEPFIIEITYSKKGFIKSVSKARNPVFTGSVKRDTSFTITVLDFIQGRR